MQRCWMCDYFIGFRSSDKATKGYCIKNRPVIRIVSLRDKCKDFSFNIINDDHFHKTPFTDSPFRYISTVDGDKIGSNYYYRLVVENPSTQSLCKRFNLDLLQIFKMDFFHFHGDD